jgi:hypothetical protein
LNDEQAGRFQKPGLCDDGDKEGQTQYEKHGLRVNQFVQAPEGQQITFEERKESAVSLDLDGFSKLGVSPPKVPKSG